MKAKLLLTALFVALACTAFGQTEKEGKSGGIVNKSKSLADRLLIGRFDTNYVVAPKNRWMVFVSGNAGYNRFNMDLPGEEFVIPASMAASPEKYPDVKDLSSYRFRLHQNTKGISVGLGYGSIRGRYTIGINNHMAQQLQIEALGRKIGVFFDYRHSKEMEGTSFDADNAIIDRYLDPYPNPKYSTADLKKMYTKDITKDYNNYSTLHIQAHYIFNHHKFSYSAARTATRIQKQSAGSPIALVDFYQSIAKFKKPLFCSVDERFTTWKVSVGGGYAYNYTPNGGKVLLHASVIPTVSLFSKANYANHMFTLDEWCRELYELYNDKKMPYNTIEEFQKAEPETYNDYKASHSKRVVEVENMVDKANRIFDATPKLTINCTARLSATWNISDHFFLGAYGVYQYSNFANKYDYSIKEHNISGQLFLGYRF